jgi:hypothetical protein
LSLLFFITYKYSLVARKTKKTARPKQFLADSSSRDEDFDDPYEVSVVDADDDDSLPSDMVTTDPDSDLNDNYDEDMYQKLLNDYLLFTDCILFIMNKYKKVLI